LIEINCIVFTQQNSVVLYINIRVHSWISYSIYQTDHSGKIVC